MLVHTRDGGSITFRQHIGDGTYEGHKFKLGITCTPDGRLLGMPVVSWDNGVTVTWEMEDIIHPSFEPVRLEEL